MVGEGKREAIRVMAQEHRLICTKSNLKHERECDSFLKQNNAFKGRWNWKAQRSRPQAVRQLVVVRIFLQRSKQLLCQRWDTCLSQSCLLVLGGILSWAAREVP